MVLVTGAAGNLGSATCTELKASGIEFRATDSRTRRDLPYKMQVENLLRREACYQLLDGCTTLVHIANRPNEHAGTPQDIFGDNCQMNINIFQAAHDIGITKIIFASSIQAIVGSRRLSQTTSAKTGIPYLPADGNLPALAGNPYAASKVAGETLLKYFAEHRGLRSAIAMRYPGLTKPEWYGWMAKHAAVEHIWKEEYADELFAWLSFADAARLTVACLKAELPGYRCYMPAHASLRINLPLADVVKRFYADAKLNVPAEQLTSLVDISRITADTGWTPIDDFRAALAANPAPNKA